MDPIAIVLRSSKSPPASAPVGGELSAEELDGNFTNLRTAAEQLDMAAEAVTGEVVDARSSRASLSRRLDSIASVATPNGGGYIVGQHYDNCFHSSNNSTLAGQANRATMAPFVVARSLRVDRMGVAVSTAVAGSLLRCFIYSSGRDSWPDQLLYEGDTDLSGAATGYPAHILDFTFEPDRLYWVGVRHSSTATIRTISTSNCLNLGLSLSTGNSYNTVIRRTIAFATPLPTTWGFTTSDFSAAETPPSIRFRCAAAPPSSVKWEQWTAVPASGGALLDIGELPADGGSAITSLEVSLDGGAPETLSGTGTGERTVLFTGTKAIQVRAVNAIGAGEWSVAKTRTALA